MPKAQAVSQEEAYVQIAVFRDLKECTLSIAGEYVIHDLDTGVVLKKGSRLEKIPVKVTPLGLQIGPKIFKQLRVNLEPLYATTITVNNRNFRGQINLIKTKEGTLLVVNVVGLEDYVKGVLYHEISHRWPIEAIKAQAVATRTYALYRRQTTTNADFDVTNDIYSQVYGGRTSEHYRTNLAVDETKGEVLVYQDQILPAYFHATCAGHTEDVSELWKQDLPPLKGVPCDFCKNSPHYYWNKNLRSKDVQDKLLQAGYKLGLIKEIKVVERNQSGRIRKLAILGRDGKTTMISGKDFRNIIGPNIIRSNNYDVVMKGYYFDVVGKGWGHGVGLCQWGAEEMSRQHYKYDEILQYYYPGADLTDYHKINFDKKLEVLPFDNLSDSFYEIK